MKNIYLSVFFYHLKLQDIDDYKELSKAFKVLNCI